MKESGKKAQCMVKVIKMIYLMILKLFNAFIGKKVWNNGERYEGEWKDGSIHG